MEKAWRLEREDQTEGQLKTAPRVASIVNPDAEGTLVKLGAKSTPESDRFRREEGKTSKESMMILPAPIVFTTNSLRTDSAALRQDGKRTL